MSKSNESDTTSEATTQSKGAKATRSTGTNSHADKVIGRETAQGFRGVEVDPTPNENYTVAGVTSGAPTPETDRDASAAAREVTGLGLTALEAADKEKTARGEK